MKVGYYPGCSMHGTAREFDESLKAIAGPLGLELVEIEDWSCCGASSAHMTDHLLAVTLAARNLALAEEQGLATVLAPCAACYNRLASARHEIATDRDLSGRAARILDRPFQNSVKVVSIVEVLRECVDTLKQKATNPLTGLSIACYYGCLLVRPAEVTGFDDAEDPTSMDLAVKAAGASPVSWRRKVDCCGGGFSLSRTGSVIRLGRAIIDDAAKEGAQAIAVACPMCHSNLDFRQKAMARVDEGKKPMPIVYITQLIGLSLGLAPSALGLKRHFVDTAPVFRALAKVDATAASAGGGA